MTLEQLNQCTSLAAMEWFERCCAAHLWCQKMTQARPFKDVQQMLDVASHLWHEMQESDLLEAYAAHPMIGDIQSLKAKYANTVQTASKEQAGALTANIETLHALKSLNERYYQQNGFIFIICASGLSAQQMLEALSLRINNSREEEIANAAKEQLKITLLRLTKFIESSEQEPLGAQRSE